MDRLQAARQRVSRRVDSQLWKRTHLPQLTWQHGRNVRVARDRRTLPRRHSVHARRFGSGYHAESEYRRQTVKNWAPVFAASLVTVMFGPADAGRHLQSTEATAPSLRDGEV